MILFCVTENSHKFSFVIWATIDIAREFLWNVNQFFESLYIPPLGIIYPPANMSSNTQQHIVILLQNGKSCHQVAAQMHVSYSTVQRLYSSVKDSLPKHPGGYPKQLIANDQHPLARESPLEQLILAHNSRDFQTSISLSKQLWIPKKGMCQDCHRAENITSFKGLLAEELWSTTTVLWRAGAGWISHMRLILMGWGQMGGPRYGQNMGLAWSTITPVDCQVWGQILDWWFGATHLPKKWTIYAW